MKELIYIWSDSAALSITIWFVVVVISLYLARTPAHRLIVSVSRLLHSGLRLIARSLTQVENRLAKRNKEVVLNAAQDNVERVIEREFHRINAVVSRDLAGYPALHRKISDIVNKVEDDYRNSTETPVSPPNWLEAVEAVSKIPQNGNAKVDRIIGDIHASIEYAHKETMEEYRKATAARHQLLKKMIPAWREVSQHLAEAKKSITALDDKAAFVDSQMKLYEQIRAQEDTAARVLTMSSLTQFVTAGLVLIVALLGGVINFQLIALPMSEMVGGSSYIGPVKTSDIAALVIIMVEIAMGLFLLDALRITRLFPVIGSMDDKMRKNLAIAAFTLLAIMATIEASLAYMRDLLALDHEALTQSLTGDVIVQAQFRWIPSIGQMVMGFVLPFALAFVAIPLESFIHSSRTVAGVTAQVSVRGSNFLVRLIGNIVKHTGSALVSLYDIAIFLPLKIEELIQNRMTVEDTKPVSAKKVSKEV